MSSVARIVKITICMIMLIVVCSTMYIGSGCSQQVADMFQPKMVRLYDKVVSSVVRIDVVYNGRSGGGTGVFIAPGLIITAGHVVGAMTPIELDPNIITVTTHTGRKLEVIECFDENYRVADLAILRVKMSEGFRPYYPKLDVTTVIGEGIFMIGAPGGLYPILTHGYIAGPLHKGMGPQSLNMQIDCTINGGNSGGPLFDMDGDLIGIVVATPNRTTGLAWCEQAASVKEMLHNWRNGLMLPKAERDFHTPFMM